jgi:hydroxymethylpyrimidine pyrophosphatase-like HAD family hydrolase
MFEISDKCYAVENAHQALKAIAGRIIGGNNGNGVAAWLVDNVKL